IPVELPALVVTHDEFPRAAAIAGPGGWTGRFGWVVELRLRAMAARSHSAASGGRDGRRRPLHQQIFRSVLRFAARISRGTGGARTLGDRVLCFGFARDRVGGGACRIE